MRSLSFILSVLAPIFSFAESTCIQSENVKSYCISASPEDIEVTPSKESLLFSFYGGFTSEPAGLASFDLESETIETLYPNDDVNSKNIWGDPKCEELPDKSISAHGFHLSKRSDGRNQLFVVSHGKRHSIEIFEYLRENGKDRLMWRGCALSPTYSAFNDIAGVSDGSFYVTHQFDKTKYSVPEAYFSDEKRAYIIHWDLKTKEFSKVLGTDGVLANGVEITEDEKSLFVAYSREHLVRKYDVKKMEVVEKYKVIHNPDNLSLVDGKYLLVASIENRTPEAISGCYKWSDEVCELHSYITAINIESKEQKILFSSETDGQIGAVTVADYVDKTLFLGTFTGFRFYSVFNVQLEEGQ